MGGDTVLKGAVIASTAEASSNSLVTGRLQAQDIANREQWSADQVSLGGGIGGIGMDRGGAATATGGTALPGVSVAGVGTVTATPPMALSAGGSQSGTTRSAIGAGTIEVTGDAASRSVAATILRDTGAANDGALSRQFTDAKRAEVSQGFQAAQVLVTETSAFFASRAREEDRLKAQAEKARQRGDAQAADGYTRKAEKLHEAYGPGSTARLVATAVSGAAGGDVTGSLSGLVQASAVNVLQGLATQQVKALADELGGSAAENSAARAALQAVVGCAGQAAGGTGDCSAGAMGAASAVVLNQLLKSGPTPSTDKDGQPLSQSAGQARDALVSTLVAAVASGAGLDATSATLAAQIETQNNSTVTPLGRYGPDNYKGLPVADVYEHDPAFRAAVKALGGLDAYEAVTKCVQAGPFCPTTPAQRAALTAYSQGSDRLEGQARIDAWLCSGETPLLCGVQAVNAFNQTPLGVRLVGTQQAIGGGLQMVTGGGMAIGGLASCAESLGAGCGLGALGAINFGMGLDNARSGVGAVSDGTPKGTIGAWGLSATTGVSPDTAEAIYGQANLAVGLVTSGVTIGRGSVPAATSSTGTQVDRAVANALASAEMPEAATTQAAVEATMLKGVPSASEIVLGKPLAMPTVQEILARSAPIAADSGLTVTQADLDTLAANGVKFTPENVLATGKAPNGQVIFLETGSSSAGLQHILEEHGADFAKKGIAEADVPSVVMQAVTKGVQVGTNGSAPVYEITYKGSPQYIAVGVSSNGFIVRANPVSTWKALK